MAKLTNETQLGLHLAAGASDKYLTSAEYIYDETKNQKLQTTLDTLSIALIEITWAELKKLRDSKALVPGTSYRITDYNCTTVDEETRSAGHLFDIIVIADSTDILNENARAAVHSGDTYFADLKLESWELKYCLDNDQNRFMWADPTNGKGVIYYMKDAVNNECPYDFKNIQFKRYYTLEYPDPSLSSQYITYRFEEESPKGIVLDIGQYYYFYTFSTIDTRYLDLLIADNSMVAISFEDYMSRGTHDNIIKPLRVTTFLYKLNNITIIVGNRSGLVVPIMKNIFKEGCYNINLFWTDEIEGYFFDSNTFEADCNNIITGSIANSTFGVFANHIYAGTDITNIHISGSSTALVISSSINDLGLPEPVNSLKLSSVATKRGDGYTIIHGGNYSNKTITIENTEGLVEYRLAGSKLIEV